MTVSDTVCRVKVRVDPAKNETSLAWTLTVLVPAWAGRADATTTPRSPFLKSCALLTAQKRAFAGGAANSPTEPAGSTRILITMKPESGLVSGSFDVMMQVALNTIDTLWFAAVVVKLSLVPPDPLRSRRTVLGEELVVKSCSFVFELKSRTSALAADAQRAAAAVMAIA